MLELKNIAKLVGERRLFRSGRLQINKGDRIGVVGRNGAGKSTLLAIMAGKITVDAGEVVRRCEPALISQLDAPDRSIPPIDPVLARHWQVSPAAAGQMSGGERTRCKIAAALSEKPLLLLADEPGANLDIKGIELLQSTLQSFPGALVIVSHDRQILDSLCTTIWEIADGELTPYRGNYSSYLTQKETVRLQRQRQYEGYLREKSQLEQAIADRQSRSAATRKTPSRMGNSEARLHKMGNQKAKASLDKAVKALETRLEKLGTAVKPGAAPTIRFDLAAADGLYSKMVIQGSGITKAFGSRILFQDAAVSIANGQKIALIGDNGCGKTTLLKLILRRQPPLAVSPQVRIGYFAQGADNLAPGQSILANILSTSVQPEEFVRRLLARLLFRGDAIDKKAAVLSGGERTRVCLAKIMVSEANVLLLDEPTNYLDLPSLEALETVLAAYPGTVVFASHDRRFVDKVATGLLLIEAGKLRAFPGNYTDLLQTRASAVSAENTLLLEHRLAEIVSRLALTTDKAELERLDKEYRQLLAARKQK